MIETASDGTKILTCDHCEKMTLGTYEYKWCGKVEKHVNTD